MSGDNPDLLVDTRGAALWLTISRPQRRNALTDTVPNGLRDAVVGAGRDESQRAIVDAGAGDRTFCAGADPNPGGTPFKPDFARLTSPLGDLARAVHECRLPTIGRINGVGMAVGMGISRLCDTAIAVDNARFGMSEVKLGFFLMQIRTMLGNPIPPRFHNEMCITERRIPLEQRDIHMHIFDSGFARVLGAILQWNPLRTAPGVRTTRAGSSPRP